jgi:hypothetical protein
LKAAAALPVLLPVFLLATILLLLSVRRVREAVGNPLITVAAAFFAGWIVDHLLLVQATDMPDISRYTASAQGIGLMLTLAICWRIAQALGGGLEKNRLRFAGWIGLAALCAFTSPQWMGFYFSELPWNLKASVGGKLSAWNVEPVRRMQSAIPPGEKFLAYLTAPARLDFRRNPIYVADWPGESSPPPGMPLLKGAEPIADYLVKQGIRYVAYSYASQAYFPRKSFGGYVSAREGRVVGRQAAQSFIFQDALAELMRTRRIIFDDGLNCVVDLAHPRSGS